ncbi:predicted protein [Naegleria gruberi]|uniref:Predicted protein n=1 Tax=Naegleria gruberi TaxID=5762 RepID=D2VK57_NAEGR|nr:uncharacterized protein NAEGRDRAFT_69277 [Naegleria gruberi]EFC42889.1 predicted protein [Naegleria gruberi]|eukprot:XP_002675633.1 predicted protein [Naegleria gruberi strain NEG-M]
MNEKNTLSTVEDDLKRKFRKLQKVIHKSIIEKDLIKKTNQIIGIIQSISETISNHSMPLYAKCSNCKVISDEALTFRSPFFGNNHFTMPIHSSTNSNTPSSFDGVLLHEYPTKSILYYFDKELIELFLEKIKTQLIDEINSDTLSSDLVLSLSILSVLLPSSFLSTNNVDDFYQKQQVFFCNNTEESKRLDDE